MNETDLIFWLWVYRIVVIGLICIISYSCWKSIRNIIRIVRIRREVYKLEKNT